MKFCVGVGADGNQLVHWNSEKARRMYEKMSAAKRLISSSQRMKHMCLRMLMGYVAQASAPLCILYSSHLIFVLIIILGH